MAPQGGAETFPLLCKEGRGEVESSTRAWCPVMAGMRKRFPSFVRQGEGREKEGGGMPQVAL